MSYTIQQKYISKNRSYVPLTVDGWVLHSTANPGATAENNYQYFNNNDVDASAHFFTDWTTIINTVPTTEQAWHAGPAANTRYLSVEMCEPSGYDVAKFNEVWSRTVWLVAADLKVRGFGVDKIFSHADISNTYHETDHLDPISFLAAYGKTMQDFRNAVQGELDSSDAPAGAFQFNPVEGLMNTAIFATRPANKTIARQYFQTLFDQIKNYLNDKSGTTPLVPIGSIHTFIHDTIPAGYLKLEGQAVSRITYSDLFALYGTTYGTGDGVTTFNLPDLRGAFLRALDGGKGYDANRTLGTYQTDEIKAHTHFQTGRNEGSTASTAANLSDRGWYNNQNMGTSSPTESVGGDETRPKNIAIIYAVKAFNEGVPAPVTIPPLLRNLSEGDTGDDVRIVQTQLNTLGFNAGTVDGIAGPMFTAAVISFQTARGLGADGIVGQITYAALFA
jgi:N-acetylmuramoyl-L-alanine amidase CwlA/microcystin-dependent protein